jgi:hypothetical protein
MRRWVFIIVVFFLASCGDDDPSRPDPPPEQPLQATSPREVADLLIIAINGKNIERYDSLLTRDFVFYFQPVDTPDDTLGLPESWSFEDEIQAVSNLFAATDVEDIRLDWRPTSPEPSDLAGADTLLVIRNVFLEVAWWLSSEEIVFLQMSGDFWLHMRRAPWTTGEGEAVWKVAIWEERAQLNSMPGQAVERTTWGAIKAYFHEIEP